MRFADFDPDALSAGERHRIYLEVGSHLDGQPLGVPLLCAHGPAPGPTLVVLACVHGDEYEGMAAIHEVFRRLEPGRLRGTILAVPTLNLPAAAAVHRFSPIDHVNLARVFPGRPDGTVTERIAYYTDRHLISRADLLVDLHSAGYQRAPGLQIGLHLRIARDLLPAQLDGFRRLIVDDLDELRRIVHVLQQLDPHSAQQFVPWCKRLQL